ncbi:hypothetical protein [Hyphomicrobium sp.]|uniref:hypothetical protein n=1 Tax=Hyphomicrobium sp. TaxID=82 RepID=UPI003F711EC2
MHQSDRIERALAIAAYITLRQEGRGALLLQRLNTEAENARRESPVALARRVLENYSRAGGTKAIRLIQP